MRISRLRAVRVLVVVAAAVLGVRVGAQNAPPQPARFDVTGDWQVITHEDQPDYGFGPDLGDYAGLPINAAARQMAISWDAAVLSQPERQAEPHPVAYIGNNRGPARISKILHPVTQTHIGYAMAGGFGRADRIVWIDGRPHPSEYSEHTWNGFSTGKWEDGAFVITTTHMKVAGSGGTLRRNGVFTSTYAKMIEYVFRTDLEMTWFLWIDDPLTLEEPMVRTYTLRWNRNGNTQRGLAFEPVDELSGKSLGWVPSYPLGARHTEFSDRYEIPYEAGLGGAESLYPEYELKLREMLKQQQPSR